MKHGGRLLVLLGALATGCGSDDSSDTSGSYYGGQTGSLIPSCGEIPSLDQGLSVPSGDSAFVIYTGQCGSDLTASDISVFGPDGSPVTVQLETIGDGAVLARAAEALVPGEYAVSTPDVQRQLVVDDPEPVPVTLGKAVVMDSSGCAVTMDLELDPGVVPYAALMSLEVSVDGEPAVPWFEYGSLVANTGIARLRLESCDPVCFDPGPHTFALTATIAGETIQPDPLEVQADVDCSQPASSGDGGFGGCALVSSAPAGSRGFWALVASLFIAFGVRRRRSR